MTSDARAQTLWTSAMRQASPETRALLSGLVKKHGARFADLFYQHLLEDDDAKTLLSQDVVSRRLHAVLKKWIEDIFSTWDPEKVPELVASQRTIGVVHGRSNIRVELVLHGASLIKSSMTQAILNSGQADMIRMEAIIATYTLIDLAIGVMSAQYSSVYEQAARKDESYRTFAATMNASLERERQRTALFDWENQFLQGTLIGRSEGRLPGICESSFGLWIRHKATALFPNDSELVVINSCMERIDSQLLPACQRELAAHDDLIDLRRLAGKVLAEAKQIRFLSDTLFDNLIHVEAGRDILTQLLNRRFMTTILSREIALSRMSGKPFSLLLIDIDHFKKINNEHGHDAGDRVLQHVANILVSNIRSGDFVFRFGGEEFLIICVELSPAQSLKVAEKIRGAIEAESIPASQGARLRVTVSIGVAPHDGHPDYQRLIDRVDSALCLAREQGRNRSVLESAPPAD